jgi:hypothetical protein
MTFGLALSFYEDDDENDGGFTMVGFEKKVS